MYDNYQVWTPLDKAKDERPAYFYAVVCNLVI